MLPPLPAGLAGVSLSLTSLAYGLSLPLGGSLTLTSTCLVTSFWGRLRPPGHESLFLPTLWVAGRISSKQSFPVVPAQFNPKVTNVLIATLIYKMFLIKIPGAHTCNSTIWEAEAGEKKSLEFHEWPGSENRMSLQQRPSKYLKRTKTPSYPLLCSGP